MKNLVMILGVLTCISIVSNLICGLWIRANQVTEISSMNFHMILGIITVVLSVATAVLAMLLAAKYIV